MARNVIDIGVEGNDGTGDSIREAFRKSNDNFYELYGVLGQGGQISTTNLSDTPQSYGVADANKIFALNSSGSEYTLKAVEVGTGLSIDANNSRILLTNTRATVKQDITPELAFHLNANGQMLGYIKNPNSSDVSAFNAIFETNLNTDGRDFAVNKGFINANYVAIAGGTMTGHLTLSAAPTNELHAASKRYVDLQPLSSSNIELTASALGDILYYNGTKWINASITGSITAVPSDNTIAFNINSNTIVNADINSSAAIAQSKLALTSATTRANPTGITQADLGVASFDNSQFTAINGWISLQSSGITLDKLQFIGGNSILGRRDGIAGVPAELTAGQIVADGDGIKNASFSSTGAMIVTAPNTYGVTAITTTGSADSLTKTGAAGELDVQSLSIKNIKLIDTSNTSTLFFTREGHTIASINGSSLANATFEVYGNISTVGAGTDITAIDSVNGARGSFTTSVTTPLLTTGNSSIEGVITGDWTLSTDSKLQATYADLAEYYEGDQNYVPGTVLIFGGEKEVTLTSIFGDRRVAGVVSNNAAYTMNAECPGIKVCIALQGRVPVNVLGKVMKGDILVTSARPGFAVVNNDPKCGAIIGKSLENKDDPGIGKIEVAVGRF
jgi:hypothetical protein